MTCLLSKDQCAEYHILLWDKMIDEVKNCNITYLNLVELKRKVFEKLFPNLLTIGSYYNYCFGCIYSEEYCNKCIFDMKDSSCLDGLWGISYDAYRDYFYCHEDIHLQFLIFVMEQVRDFPIKKINF
jgi:hypothetical protein